MCGQERFEQAQQFQFLLGWQERCFEGISSQFAKVLVGESKGLLGEMVFARQRGAKQPRIVGVQSDHQALVEVALHRMLGDRCAHSCAEIAGQADLDWYLPVGEFLDQVRILPGREAVADALGMQIERAPNGFGRTRFPGMGCQAQAVILGVAVDAAKQFWRSLLLISADAYSDNMAIAVAHGQFEHLLGGFNAEMACSVKNPQQRDAKVAGALGTSALEAFEDGREVLLAVETHSNGHVDFRMQGVFFFQVLHQAVRDEFVIIRPAQVGAHFLEGHQKTLEVGVVVERLGFRQRGSVAVPLAEFQQSCCVDRALEM